MSSPDEIQFYDLQGNLLRSFGGFVEKGGMMGTTWYWKGNGRWCIGLLADADRSPCGVGET